MTSHIENPTGQSAQPAETPAISRETLLHCAEFLARGDIDWPGGLTDEQEIALTTEVRQVRRTHLRKFFAGQIAADIAREIKSQDREVSR